MPSYTDQQIADVIELHNNVHSEHAAAILIYKSEPTENNIQDLIGLASAHLIIDAVIDILDLHTTIRATDELLKGRFDDESGT